MMSNRRATMMAAKVPPLAVPSLMLRFLPLMMAKSLYGPWDQPMEQRLRKTRFSIKQVLYRQYTLLAIIPVFLMKRLDRS